MKFLAGLLAGAALILAVSGDPRFGRIIELTSSVWSALVQTTADYLFPAPDAGMPEAIGLTTDVGQPYLPANSTVAEASLAAALPSVEAEVQTKSGTDLAEGDSTVADPSPEPVVVPARELLEPRDEATEFVWKPFQSQMSANGFANRLGISLNHPFQVHRQGPGQYQVGFSYESDEERARVLQEIAQITGTLR